MTDSPLRFDPRGLNDEIDQVTHGCINPFPSVAHGDRRVGAKDAGLYIQQGTRDPWPPPLPRVSDKPRRRHRPTHTIGAWEGATGQPRSGSGSSGIVMHESPASPRLCQAAPRSRNHLATGRPLPGPPPPARAHPCLPRQLQGGGCGWVRAFPLDQRVAPRTLTGDPRPGVGRWLP